MKGTAFKITILLFFFSLVLGVTGCGTLENLVDSFTKPVVSVASRGKADKSGLKKKVLIQPFLNQADMPQKRFEEVTQSFLALLEKDERLLLETTKDPAPSNLKVRSASFGIVTDADAAKKAEEIGANVLLSVVLSPYEMRLKRTGIWPLRKLKREVEVSMVVNALDLMNGTLFLTQLEKEKIDFAVDELEEEEETRTKIEMPEIDDKAFTRLWSRIVERQVSGLRTALRYQPWTGRVLSADDGTIIVNAGTRVGLTSGSVFEVFSRGDPIRSASGRSIFLLGPKVGEIKALEVHEDSASAVPIVEASYKAGQVIRVKK